MMDEVKLRRYAVDTGVPLGTVEKDLAITCALKALSETPLRNLLVFKGGTAIKKIYAPGARFSEDMDFTAIGLEEEKALEELSVINEAKVDSITFHRIVEDQYTRQGRNYRLPYSGPLRHRNSVRMDLSFRNDILGNIETREVIAPYGEYLNSSIMVLSLTEIISEKIRALMTRESPRDYYDVWAHLHGVRDRGKLRMMTERKCTVIGYDYDPANIFRSEKLIRVEAYWKIRLQHLMPHCPEFQQVITELTRELNFLQK